MNTPQKEQNSRLARKVEIASKRGKTHAGSTITAFVLKVFDYRER